ncbi:hypothetical protein DYU05_07980 [Mucilaginibacter terrenus]|uniref:Uncharacterized protein n=2 Tax=Mucilaginibacter terrenus TaxID=2482727 RepID=A0A3E2NWZ6_9SPHI|nr:hypothetical protein DYU05_07980 [Mucilaginibacter terrenus]
MGALAILGGGLQEFCIWLANPLAVLTIVGLFKNFRFTIVTSIAAFLLALSFLSWKNILGSESGVMGTIVSFEAGYYLWLSSIIVLMLGTNYYFYKLTKS